ncbi:MAG: kelch repeat-containing protein, partial [Planctomycetota bacterium]
TEIYDEHTRAFSPGPTMTAGRSVHAQVQLKDGRYMLTGGVDAKNVSQASTEFFDPKTGKFTAGPAMAQKRMGHTATLLSDGRVLVTGGIPDTSNQTAALTSSHRTTEIYNPKTNSWSAGPNLSTYRAMHSAITLGDGRVLLAGGLSWRNFFFFKVPQISRTCDLFDPKTNRMSRTGSMAGIRAMHAATLLPNGKVLVAGGLAGVIDQSNAGKPTNAAEIYDPAFGSWSAALAMTGSRALPAGVMLSDGRFAVIGGGSGSLWLPTATKTIEVYDHKTNKWSAMPNMITTRAGTLAVELRACGILVVGGGSGSTATSTNAVELLIR